MPRLTKIVQNIFSNWCALGVTTLVGFFLSPFIVHHLGNLTYGVWVLTFSFSSYMNLLDLGLRGAVTRYVSKGTAQLNYDEANQAISGALWIRIRISLAVIAAGFLLAAIFHKMFSIPQELQYDARLAILISCVNVAVTLISGVFGSVLSGLHRFDLLSGVTIFQSGLRAIGIVWLLRAGHGILAIASWELWGSIVAAVVSMLFTVRVFPQLKLTAGRPSAITLRKLWNYSFYVFVIHTSVQVAYYSDNLVVGVFLTPVAVTVYAIGGMLISYARNIITSMTSTFMPLASNYDAVGNYDNLRRLMIQGTRAALLVALPIEAALFVRGHTFISLWMGNQYAQPSGDVMRILLLSVLFASANTTSVGIVFGMEKLKPIAIWAIGEAVANLALSVLLVRHIGIYGVAWGSAIPSVLCELILWPTYVCKLVAIPVTVYLWQTWFRTGIAIIPFALACIIIERFWHPSNLLIFFLQIASVLPLVPLFLMLVFRREFAEQIRDWKRQRMMRKSLQTPSVLAV